ncbi:hypothetical protein IW140_001301 [Coemansia sp. RSA 1813]|nr:hypothetical protein EV178_001111 [Coemansia sp. RSA 1646]KAJ1770333.1 hypothetical protein LPJ74_003284 [Coemansia sp. RSA 1843]KAJ2091651.1 hypothetical protein IW138_001633 [Coemansia sp. RSA 986]KAJ2216946.1 hypothetical protein EV179_000981 [Coemansia sp. RSA 487]KAJ2571951.1 hypothetical protein IW140_001301 [Coemansia sp. RSA 1813]
MVVDAQTLEQTLEQTPEQTQNRNAASSGVQHKYMEKCTNMEKMFMQMATQHGNEPEDSPWTPLVSLTDPYPITIQGHATKPFCFRVTFYAPTTPETAFDLLADVTRRSEWDELTDSAKVVEKLGHGDAIHYVKMKAIWPTSARDSVLLARITKVDINNSIDGGKKRGYLNVSQSVEDSRIPEDTAHGIVRMEAGIAGQLITDALQEDKARLGLDGDKWCKVVQIADGDLKGWIPSSVLKFIATQALPRSLTKVCGQLAAMPLSTESQLLARVACPKDANNGNLAARTMGQTTAATTEQTIAVQGTRDGIDRQQSATTAASTLVRRRWSNGSWSAWFKVIMRYATPAVIAAITSIVVSIVLGERRWRRSVIRR